MKRLLVLVPVVVVAGALAIWWYSPRQVVKRRTQQVLEVLTLDTDAGRTKRQLGVYRLSALLAPQVEFATPTIDEANGTFDRHEVESAYSWLCDHAKECRFEMKHIDSLEVGDLEAEVTFTLNATVELAGVHLADGEYQATFHWQRDPDQSWLLTKAVWGKPGK